MDDVFNTVSNYISQGDHMSPIAHTIFFFLSPLLHSPSHRPCHKHHARQAVLFPHRRRSSPMGLAPHGVVVAPGAELSKFERGVLAL